MKVTAFNKYTGEKIYEIELKECRIEHIADVSRNGERQLGRVASFDDQEVR